MELKELSIEELKQVILNISKEIERRTIRVPIDEDKEKVDNTRQNLFLKG